MKTQVYWFIFPVGVDPNWITEVNQYGPSNEGFHTDLGIHIDPAHVSDVPIVAVTNGLIRLIPESLIPNRGTLVLTLDARDLKNLDPILGGSPVFFVYRNVDSESVANEFETELLLYQDNIRKINAKRRPQEEPRPVPTLKSLKNSFIKGKFWVSVKAGRILGRVSQNIGPNFPALLGFEIVYTPLLYDPPNGNQRGFQRIIDMIQFSNLVTRRLDPVTFYHRLRQGTSPDAEIHPLDEDHPLFNILSQRVLLEVRDEYNRPITGLISLRKNGMPQTVDLVEGDRGTAELSESGSYLIEIEDHVLTELPSGSEALQSPTKLLVAPEHWMLQSMFMAHVDSDENWFAQNNSSLPLFTSENRVTPLIDGNATFKEMVKIIRQIRGSTDKHYLRIAGWWLSDQFPMIEKDADSTFEKLTKDVAKSGAKVHALIWNQTNIDQDIIVHPDLPPIEIPNADPVKRLNALKQNATRKGFAILDSAEPNVSSHHQKLIIAGLGNEPTVAFCGGIDINPNRHDTPAHGANYPYHDIHAKIEGPAVSDLNLTFVERWNANKKVAPIGGLPRIPNNISPETPPTGTHFVQVTRTYPKKGNYPFAQVGELGTLLTLQRAIRRAQRFIYFEDQYAHPFPKTNSDGSGDTVGILSDLLEALKRIEFLIIVVPENQTPVIQRMYRYRFLRVLLQEAKKPNIKGKVLIFYGRRSRFPNQQFSTESELFQLNIDFFKPLIDPSVPLGRIINEELIFLHSKVWLIDDHYVKIGSTNVNRRSLTHDSEVDLHVIDGALTHGARTFALDFRLALWGEWLQMQNVQQLLEDPTYALQFWESPSVASFVRPYDPAANGGSGTISTLMRGVWDSVIDPDGR